MRYIQIMWISLTFHLILASTDDLPESITMLDVVKQAIYVYSYYSWRISPLTPPLFITMDSQILLLKILESITIIMLFDVPTVPVWSVQAPSNQLECSFDMLSLVVCTPLLYGARAVLLILYFPCPTLKTSSHQFLEIFLTLLYD